MVHLPAALRTTTAAAATVLLVLSVPAAASAFDRFVNPAGTCSPAVVGGLPEHDTIQEAEDNAAPGDEIGVCAGNYAEDVAVDTPDVSFVAIGHVLLTPGGAGGPCFNVISNGVTIQGFEIAFCSAGIRLVADLGTIRNNILHDNEVGIIVLGQDNTVLNNLVRNSTDTGISVNGDSAGTVVRNNTVRANALRGIHVAAFGEAGRPVTIFKNLVQYTTGDGHVGIHVTGSEFGVVSFNSVSFNGQGIVLTDIDEFLIMRNNVSRSDPGPDCVWDGLGTNTFDDNNCRTEVPPGAWD